MDVPLIPFVPGPPRHARETVTARLAGLVRAILERAGGPRPRRRPRRDDGLPSLDFIPRLRDYPWRRSG